MTRRNGSGRHAPISVAFTAREWSILLDHTFADPEYANRLVEKGARWVAGFTASELDDILGYVAAAANHTPRARLRGELGALYDRLDAMVEAGCSCPRCVLKGHGSGLVSPAAQRHVVRRHG